ncbi:hypothetical protein [Paracoccus sp. 22332]|uniref:hypothetical protein n=1 Tax=Paracoccus sp. 22332 TaxID=3453913 RepID=UPI003F824327
MPDPIDTDALRLPTVRCNNCMTDWSEDDLEGRNCAVDGEPCQACPNCGTDHHLMDLDMDSGVVGTISTARHPVVRYSIGHEGGDVFGLDSDYDGPTLTVEVADLDDACAMLSDIALAPQLAAENLALRADLSALRAREAEMRAALRPFAEYMHTNEGRMDCDYFGKPLPDDLTVGWIYLTHGDFRRARAALSQPDSGEGAT